MTNGDYVYFTYWSSRLRPTDHPFTHYAPYVVNSNDLDRRRRAFYVVKQVRAANCRQPEPYKLFVPHTVE